MKTVNQIQDNETFKNILDDSCGGIMYDVANQGKYKCEELDKLISEANIEHMNGIMKGAIQFYQS